jgi:hypothetical protein
MDAKTAEFRANYKSNINPMYNGPLHLLAVYGLGIVGIWWFTRHLHDVTLAQGLFMVPVFLLANIFEWSMHNFPMHHRIKLLHGVYTRHTLNHHQYFTQDVMTVDSTKEFRIIFFPPYALATFMIMSAVPAFIFGKLWNPNVGWLLMTTTTGFYLMYETFHYCCHVHENWFVRYCPLINTIRRHHTAHHNKAIMMDLNMNLTIPFADWLFGTSDLNRGVLGHLFNGYSEKHMKPEIKERIARYEAKQANKRERTKNDKGTTAGNEVFQ